MLNILSNFIPHKFVVCDGKNPPWSNKKIRALIQANNAAFKNYRNIDFKCRLKYLQACLNVSIEVS